MVKNMFANAKAVNGKVKAKKADDKRKVAIKGLEAYASICALEDTIKALKDTFRAQVNEGVTAEFVREGKHLKRRPDNFRGTENNASASCELRKRSSASSLTDAEVELLERHGVSFTEVGDVVETYIINPAYKDNEELLNKVGKALGKVAGIPDDFLQLQVAAKKKVTTDTSLDEVFAKSPELIEPLLAVVGTMAVKPKLENGDVSTALDTVKKLLKTGTI